MSPGTPDPGPYPPIDSYALLSDTHTAALVAPDGAIEWLCAPRFDGESLCARLLDRERGGAIEVSVADAGPPEREYLTGSLVLRSTWTAPDGAVDVVDCLSLHPPADDGGEQLVAGHRLVRVVRCTSGSARVTVRVDLRPGYATRTADWEGDGPSWRHRDPALTMTGDVALTLGAGGVLTAERVLHEGEGFALALAYDGTPSAPVDLRAGELMCRETTEAWRAWSRRRPYDGYAADRVNQSALVLRALAFDNSGALVAAPTTSLPEVIGGVRNWDYRYTWHRDASLHVLALFRLGHEAEGRRYLDFLLGPALEGRTGMLPPMAGIDGGDDGEEIELDHLEGYRGSRPVRVGNEAMGQVQHDTYGHVLDAAYVFHRMTGLLGQERWSVLAYLVDQACDIWRTPDHGVWEVRGPERHYVNSKIMLWVCLDRGVKLAEELDPDSPSLPRWRDERDQLFRDVMDRGYDPEVGAFTQSYGSTALDASVLQVSLVGMLPGDDERVVSTIDRIIERLGDGPALVHRYDAQEADDGLPGEEGAFLLCSFDVVSALVLAGRVDEARDRFEWLCSRAGALGLFSEEMDADGTALGNYPQAFTHLALIEAAVNLDSAGDGEALHAWAERYRENR